MMEAHGGEGVLRFFKYIAARTDIALGMFNSPSSGYVLTPVESARIYDEVPAVCATKEGAFRPEASRRLHELAPNLAVWECDRTVYRAGWLRAGIVCPAQLGTAGYLFETPQKRLFSEYWDLVLNDKLLEAMDYGRDSGLDQFDLDIGSWWTCYPGRADYFTHWGGAFKYAASRAGPADRRLSAFPAPASGATAGGQGADRERLSPARAHRLAENCAFAKPKFAVHPGSARASAAVVECSTDRYTVWVQSLLETPFDRSTSHA